METAGKELRVLQTLAELTRLDSALGDWQKKRTDADKHPDRKYRGQYQSQVTVIVREVKGAAQTIADSLKEMRDKLATLPLGTVYQDCARHDRRIIWLWRAWTYFREKFDQRDDPSLSQAVRAADEVLWSCYKPFFKETGTAVPPAPLPYIEYTYSPTAVRVDQSSHVEKEEEIDEGPLQNFFASLPLPLLQLPPMVVTSPWAHVLIGHEAGHFIQDSILPARAYRAVFREQVQAAAAKVSPRDAEAWGKWAAEIFADLYSVLMMGPWAVWVMAQFEVARPGNLTTRGAGYPSPLGRIYLLARFASRLGLADADGVMAALGIDPKSASAGSPEAQRDLEIAEEVAHLIVAPLPGDLGTLSSLVAFQPKDYAPERGLDPAGETVQWSEALLGRSPKSDNQDLRAARMVAAGAAGAFSQVTEMGSGAQRAAAISTLQAVAFARMINCAEVGTRAAPQTMTIAPQSSLSRTIFGMSDDDLFR